MKPFKKLEKQVGKKLLAVEKLGCYHEEMCMIFDDSYSCISFSYVYEDVVLFEEPLDITNFRSEPDFVLKHNIFSQEQFDELDNKDQKERVENEVNKVLEAKKYWEENKHLLE